MPKQKNNRRDFLKLILSTGTVTGLVTPLQTNSKIESNNKIKMLTADGKLVEVDKSVLEKNADLERASNKEVFEWMDSKHKS